MITKIYSASVSGINSHIVTVEAIVKKERPSFTIVGMGDMAIRESRKRIVTALESSHCHLGDFQITVNLAPADIKKEGASFDFPIAIALLHAAGFLKIRNFSIEKSILIGELSFDGSLRPVKGILSIAIEASLKGFTHIFVPLENVNEASLIPQITVIGIASLEDFMAAATQKTWKQAKAPLAIQKEKKEVLDFSHIQGQAQAKRLLAIAAAGNHNIIFFGPPGSGKTMLAERLPSIMPPLTFEEMIETTRIYSVSNIAHNALVTERPFRAPHHGISLAGMIGGGTPPQPGEISLAHNGILFLDEFGEFRRSVIEGLRQPLESRFINLTRSQITIELPASFLLIAAMNPCPCGHFNDTRKPCVCSQLTLYNYWKKLSGPLLDRIDLQLFIGGVEINDITARSEISSEKLYEGVCKARDMQHRRSPTLRGNALIGVDQLTTYCPMTSTAEAILKEAFERFNLSMRSYHKIIRVSRTIADMEGENIIQEKHVKEAFLYRGLEQKINYLKNKK